MRQFESRLTRGATPLATTIVAGDPTDDARLVLASGLTAAGYQVRVASTGDELLHEARSDDVGLIVAEVNLACTDGSCAIELLKGTAELRHIPILAYATSGRVVSEARALASGANRFVGDPCQLGAMFDIVASLLRPEPCVTEPYDRASGTTLLNPEHAW